MEAKCKLAFFYSHHKKTMIMTTLFPIIKLGLVIRVICYLINTLSKQYLNSLALLEEV